MTNETNELEGKAPVDEIRKNQILRFRIITFAIVILALSTLSFHGTLDNFSSEHVNATTKETIAIFAVSKLINASVSVLQTFHAKIPFIVSLQIGEYLDPLNDAIERLSEMLTWATGSLLLQSILLDMASSWAFKWIFLGAGIIAFLGLLLFSSRRLKELKFGVAETSKIKLDRFCIGTIRVFVILAILRFIVPVFVGTSLIVGELLLQPALNADHAELKAVSRNLSIDEFTAISEEPESVQINYAQEKNDKLSELAALRDSNDEIDTKITVLDAKIAESKKEIGLRKFVPKFLRRGAPNSQVLSLEEKLEDLKRDAKDIEKSIETKISEMECIERKIEGKSCDSIFNQLFKSRMEKLRNFIDSSHEYVTSVAELLILVLAKNILLPLLFLYLAWKGSRKIIKWVVNMQLEFHKEIEDGRHLIREK